MRKANLFTAVLLATAMIAPVLSTGCGASATNRAATSAALDDATISTRVKTALLNAPDISPTKVDVETSQGVVTLSGSVKSKEEEQKAIETARRVNGVRDVKSALQIQP
jgi:hyperosmotically inducible periplasmic protein